MELLVYKASAGSGKTFTLAVEYIKHLIINPRAYRQILAVTFTNKATAEMKERILTQLYGIWKGAPSSEAYLERIKNYKLKIKEEGGDRLTDGEIRQRAGMALQYMLHDYSRFRVETIDSFFQSVMRNLARELELSPNLNIELNNSEVLSDAVDSLIEKLTPTSPVLAWLLDYIDERIRDDKRWNVSNEVKSFGRNIFDESYIERGEKLRQCLRTPNTLKLYRDVLRDMETEALEQMKSFYDQFEGELEGHALTPEDLKGGARGIGSYFRKLRDGRLSDKDVLNATLQNSLADAKNWATKTSSRKDDIICLAETSLMPLLQEAERMRPQRNRTLNSCRLSLQHLNKLQLLNHIDEEVRTLNREHNRFLLSDTNALLHKLVREGDSSFVFEKIGANIRNVMIDEFQDTSRMQWDNFRLLLLEGLSQGADSLIVGDVKQSIYRWRNGDWGILNSLGNEELKMENRESSSPLNNFPVRVETLKTNRRSETNIIRFNNQVFTAAIDYLNALHLNELKEDCLPLKRAYADVVQESPKNTEYGYVKAAFLEPDDEHNYTEQTLLALGEEVQRLLEEGVTLNDITILVRKNKNIPPIADYFDKELHLSVVSDEAFRLDASLAICMLMDALRCLSNPENRIAEAALMENYKLQMTNDEQPKFTTATPLPEAFTSRRETLRLMPLYELLEELFSIFGMSRIEKQDAYLFSFFDAVTVYLQEESGNKTGCSMILGLPPCCKSNSLNFSNPFPFFICCKSNALPSSSVCTRLASKSIFAPNNKDTSNKSPLTLPFNTSMASMTSRLLPMYIPSGCSIPLMIAVTSLPTCVPISTIIFANALASSFVFIKAPLPHLTSNTMPFAPAAIFFDIMLAAMSGKLSTVPVTSRKAYSFLSAGVRLSVCPINTKLLFFANATACCSLISTRKLGIASRLSMVPPENPKPRPLILTTGTPTEATKGANINVVVSATPPVLCLSTL